MCGINFNTIILVFQTETRPELSNSIYKQAGENRAETKENEMLFFFKKKKKKKNPSY